MAGVIVRAKAGQDMVRTVEDIARAAEDRAAEDIVRSAEDRHGPARPGHPLPHVNEMTDGPVEPDHDEKRVTFGADIVPLARDPAILRRTIAQRARGTHGSDQGMDCMVWRQ
jgi:hypothetical protein